MELQRLDHRTGFFEQLANTTIKRMLTRFEKSPGQVPEAKAWFDPTPNEHQTILIIENKTARCWPRIIPKDPPAGWTLST
jgi:hypothetical protein